MEAACGLQRLTKCKCEVHRRWRGGERVREGKDSPQVVVVEAVLLIPQPLSLPQLVHGVHNHHEMFKELGGHVLKDWVVERQLQSYV